MRPETRKRILKEHKNRCNYCGATSNLEIDHIIPISRGGREDEINMQVLCKKCNGSKGNRININEWMKYDPEEDCIWMNKEMPLYAIRANELKAAIELIFKYRGL